MYSMREHSVVSEIMSTDLVTLKITDSLTKAEQLFKEYKIRHLPVLSNGLLVGMLSYTDLVKISLAETCDDDNVVDMTIYNMFTLEQVMIKEVKTVSDNTTIRVAAEVLASKNFRALPVVKAGSLVGMVTSTDLIKYLITLLK